MAKKKKWKIKKVRAIDRRKHLFFYKVTHGRDFIALCDTYEEAEKRLSFHKNITHLLT